MIVVVIAKTNERGGLSMPVDNSNVGIMYLNYGTPQQVCLGKINHSAFMDEGTCCPECRAWTTELIDDRCHVCNDDRRQEE